jgi:hypothetical protein
MMACALLGSHDDEETIGNTKKLQGRVATALDRIRLHWRGGFPQTDRQGTTSTLPGNGTARRHEGDEATNFNGSDRRI